MLTLVVRSQALPPNHTASEPTTLLDGGPQNVRVEAAKTAATTLMVRMPPYNIAQQNSPHIFVKWKQGQSDGNSQQ
jgi:hypothetical protein